MFDLRDSGDKQIEASLNLSKGGGGHSIRLRLFGQQLPPLVVPQEDGTFTEMDGGREVVYMLGGGNPLDEDEQALENSVAQALQAFITAKGI
jgi:hypothetical protein